jgi:hypothetical protein
MHKPTSLCLVILLVAAAATAHPARAQDAPPLPTPISDTPTGNCHLDNIFFGATPPGGEQSRVLVFVHGLNGLASDWWSPSSIGNVGQNDMYELAYRAGYRTAFVNLTIDTAKGSGCKARREPAKNMLTNAAVLDQQINLIAQYYRISKVDLITHSKGGVDAQAALVWMQAWTRVDHIFMLATPNQGSLIADLLWSPAGDDLGIFGQRDGATFSLQSPIMQLFRELTDSIQTNSQVKYYTAAGTGWNQTGSLFAATGQYLQTNPDGGDNDGLVTVGETYLPYATPLFQQPWDHLQLFIGRNAFPYIHAVLLKDDAPPPQAPELKFYLPLLTRAAMGLATRREAARAATEATGPSAMIVRSGKLAGPRELLVPIEPQALGVGFSLYAAAGITATLLSPDGKEHALELSSAPALGFFAATAQRASHEASPVQPGTWTLRLAGPAGAGYLLIVGIESSLRVAVAGLPATGQLGQTIELTASATASAAQATITQSRLRLRWHDGATGEFSSTGGPLRLTFDRAGLAGLTMEVTGTLDGVPFERSFVRSLAVTNGQAQDLAAVLALLR